MTAEQIYTVYLIKNNFLLDVVFHIFNDEDEDEEEDEEHEEWLFDLQNPEGKTITIPVKFMILFIYYLKPSIIGGDAEVGFLPDML